MSDVSVFFANAGVDEQLWRTDGTAAGTFLLASFNLPNSAQSLPVITVADGIAYFLMPSGSSGPPFQLWRSDGTVAGTYTLGPSGENPPPSTAPQVAQVGNLVFYLGQDASHTDALFASVGGQPGQFVATLVGSNPSVRFLGSVGGDLLLSVGNVLWTSDGTAAGTHAMADGEAGSTLASPTTPVLFDGAAYLVANDGVHGPQAWRTDGQSASLVPAAIAGANASALAVVGGHLIISNGATLTAWDGSAASSTQIFTDSRGVSINPANVSDGKLYFVDANQLLYTTDGTAAGTTYLGGAPPQIQSLVPVGSKVVASAFGDGVFVSDGAANSLTLATNTNFDSFNFVRAGSKVFFTANNATQLWVSDGTAAGTHLVMSGLSINGLGAVGDSVVFADRTTGNGFEPWISDGAAAGTHPITQIHPTGPGQLLIYATNGVPVAGSVGNDLYFVAPGPGAAANTDIWVSDGTVAGTGALPLPGGTQDFSLLSSIVAVGGKIYFEAIQTGVYELWVASNLTPGVAPGPLTGGVLGNNPTSPPFMTPFDGKLFFSAQGSLDSTDGTTTTQIANVAVLAQPVVFGADLLFLGSDATHGAGLFKSDGTSAGTQFIAAAPSTITGQTFTVSGARAFFDAGDATGGGLWVTDGSAAGTHRVGDVTHGPSNPTQITAFGSGVAFTASDLTHGQQVWFSDGTAAGTFQLDINQTTQQASLSTSHFVQFNGKTWFVANDGTHGDQLWSSDGTTAGTAFAAELSPSAQFGGAESLVSVGGRLLFVDSQQRLWSSDGTQAGTVALATSVDVFFNTPVVIGGLAYFAEGNGNGELFSTDGTAAGTHDLGISVSAFMNLTVAGSDLFYESASNGALSAYNTQTQVSTSLAALPSTSALVIDIGGQLSRATGGFFDSATVLWVTDGTAAGTVQVAQSGGGYFQGFTALGGKFYFADVGGASGLWVTDGTAAGASQLFSNLAIQSSTLTAVGGDLFFVATNASNVTGAYEYNPVTAVTTALASGGATSTPIDITPVGTGAFFVADDAGSTGELFHLDSAGNVVELTSPTNGELGAVPSNSNAMAPMNGGLVFAADDTTHGQSLFFSNGSSVTFLAQVQNAFDFSVIGGLLYFDGTDATHGAQLWVSDGTPGGTHRVTDATTTNSANASEFTAVGNELFFSANDGVHGQALWVFNGQPGGASMVAALNPTDLSAMGGAAYFIASGELWRSDGTAPGTTAITTSANGASPQDLTVDGAQLYFFGSDSAHGAGLFVSDGTAGGTHFVRGFSAITAMTVQAGHLYFQGSDNSGSELWTSDGTLAGTTKLSSTGFDPGSSPTGFADLTPAPATIATHDFNGDGFSDLLFSQTNGTLAEWLMSGTSIVGGGAIGAPGGTWSAIGTGDFADQGRAGILFQDGSGNLALWEMNGTAIVGGGAIGNPGGSWTAKGVGDFNGDGSSDILFQDASGNLAIWEMNGTQIVGGGNLGGPGGSWAEKGVGDFNGDGRSDILFQDAAGNLAIWEMNGTQIIGGGNIGNPGAAWTYKGIGDFNGDGTSDILFRNSSSGDYAIWEMNGTSIIGGGDIGAPGGTWQFVGIGDYNGDGHADILFQDASGALAIWEMNGTSIIGGGQIGNPGSQWHVLG